MTFLSSAAGQFVDKTEVEGSSGPVGFQCKAALEADLGQSGRVEIKKHRGVKNRSSRRRLKRKKLLGHFGKIILITKEMLKETKEGGIQ